MKFKTININNDITIAGSGIPGICAAIQAARSGLTVALINNRGFLGGNASPEIRIHICGADGSSEFNFYARETGIVEELRLENLYRNPQGNSYLWHTVLLDFILKEKNITLFLNTNIDEVHTDECQAITSIEGSQLGSEKRFKFMSPVFIDNTGDGTVGYLANAKFRLGRESKSEFNERIAPDQADDKTILSTLSFYSTDTKRPAPFKKPFFAEDVPIKEALKYREIPDKESDSTRYENYRMQWFYEVGHKHHPINGAEAILFEHRQLVWGIWDHIKNSGLYNSSTYDIAYMSPIPGKRESRRLEGDYILDENDIVYQKDFDDTIGYGGWSIDLHAIEGFFSTDLINRHYILNGIYAIPYRSCYSVNVPNLLVAGRCISTTHIAFGSTRVMATLGVLGQSLGIVAELIKKHTATPRLIGEEHINELKQELLNNDLCFFDNKDQNILDLVQETVVSASSSQATQNTSMILGKPLEENIAIIIPVVEHLNFLEFLIKTSEDTTLIYEIWTPTKKQNYNPEVLVKESQIKLTSTDQYMWQSLPINCDSSSGKLFIKLMVNPKISIGYNKEKINGIFTLVQKALPKDSTYTNIKTHELMHSLWEKSKETICFKYEGLTNIYGPQSILNGLSRNYGLPNLWLSEPSDEAWVQFTFNKPKNIQEMIITFDSNLDFFYDNLEIQYDFNTIPEIVKDYQVIASYGEYEEIIADVKNNYQRVNRLSFNNIKANSIIIKMTATNGSKRFGIYDVKLF